ncbi:MAG TPA: hypothetical protein VGP64_13670, partial [Polyangia bacterium]
DPELGRRYANAREMAADLEAAARNGAALTGALVADLFGRELKEEAHRLATFPVDGAAAPLASASSI